MCRLVYVCLSSSSAQLQLTKAHQKELRETASLRQTPDCFAYMSGNKAPVFLCSLFLASVRRKPTQNLLPSAPPGNGNLDSYCHPCFTHSPTHPPMFHCS
ncbi:hypothetical protein AMECASPLE_028438 [Ameca splendens]|uniref:Secreted protein n=1 Tax=Ameca splendens TaxID=208324 RepID=A0ABV0XUF7_9TELE